MCLPNFNVFGDVGRHFITEKFKDSLIVPVLMTFKSVTNSPCLYLEKYRILHWHIVTQRNYFLSVTVPPPVITTAYQIMTKQRKMEMLQFKLLTDMLLFRNRSVWPITGVHELLSKNKKRQFCLQLSGIKVFTRVVVFAHWRDMLPLGCVPPAKVRLKLRSAARFTYTKVGFTAEGDRL